MLHLVLAMLRHAHDCRGTAASQCVNWCALCSAVLAKGVPSCTCFRQRGQLGVCTQVSAALKAQLHPSAEMQAALQLQDAAFDSLDEGVLSEACRTGGAPEPGALHARMHDAFRRVVKPASVHDRGMASDAEGNADAYGVMLEIPQAQPLK